MRMKRPSEIIRHYVRDAPVDQNRFHSRSRGGLMYAENGSK